MAKNINDYAKKVGNFLLETTRDAFSHVKDDAVQAERDMGLNITISALYDAHVNDDEIIRLLQKYYGISTSHAQELLRIEKQFNIHAASWNHIWCEKRDFQPKKQQNLYSILVFHRCCKKIVAYGSCLQKHCLKK